MAYKDPPKDKSMNAPGCALVLIAVIGAAAAVVALVGAPEGWWA
jgi:hypothetical protein